MERSEALQLRESTHALPADSVEFPEALQEERVQRLVERGLSLEEAQSAEESERSKLIPLRILRPCVGKGRGRHVYEADMLRENAEKFQGWRQFVDHLSPEARKAAKGLPRSIRDLGGRIVESYWDANVPAENGFGPGAVVGWSLPTPFIRELAENDPELVEASISANATSVRPVQRDGQRAWLVEGIEDHGSVDWVTEAGAGGKVVALMEAVYEGDTGMGLLETMSDEEFISYVEEVRPHLLTEQPVEVEEQAAEPAEGSVDADVEAYAAKLMKKDPKMSRATALAFAKNALAKAKKAAPADQSASVQEAADEGDDMAEITPEVLQEALQSDGFRETLDQMVDERTRSLVESAVADERELIRAEAKADADRQLSLRDMRDEAHRQIAEAKLPDVFAARARSQFDLTEHGPTGPLDVVDDVDDDGKVTKPARDKLQEAVDAAIQDQRELLAAARPTRVTGQGPGAPAKRGDGENGEEPKKGEGTLYGSMLQEAGVDPSTAWDD